MPIAAVEAFRPYYPKAAIGRLHFSRRDLGVEALAHFGFFRKSMPRASWDGIAQWLVKVLQRSTVLTRPEFGNCSFGKAEG